MHVDDFKHPSLVWIPSLSYKIKSGISLQALPNFYQNKQQNKQP